jgi:hypothetical protein
MESSLKAFEGIDDEFSAVVARNHDSDLEHEDQHKRMKLNMEQFSTCSANEKLTEEGYGRGESGPFLTKPSSLISTRSEKPNVYRGPESAEMQIVSHALLNTTAQARDFISFSFFHHQASFPASISRGYIRCNKKLKKYRDVALNFVSELNPH